MRILEAAARKNPEASYANGLDGEIFPKLGERGRNEIFIETGRECPSGC